MQTYFNIRYELDKESVHHCIARQINKGADYICVADGVILNIANRNPEYLEVVNGGMFSICDSSYVPLYLKWIYGRKYQQYSEARYSWILSVCESTGCFSWALRKPCLTG